MAESPIPDASEADALEQSEPVDPDDDGPEIKVRAIPVEASEADVIEQSIDVPVEEDERT